MNGTVHALQHGLQPLQSLYRDSKPQRAEVEAAIRTIIRWAGDDPEREGLIETPARVVRALEEFFSGYGEDPAGILQKSFEEIDGYDEMVVLRDVAFRKSLRTPYRAHHRAGLRRLCSARACGRHQQAGAHGAGIRQALANSRKNDRADRQYDRCRTQTKRRRRGYQGGASLHDHARGPQTGQQSGHEPHAGMLS